MRSEGSANEWTSSTSTGATARSALRPSDMAKDSLLALSGTASKPRSRSANATRTTSPDDSCSAQLPSRRRAEWGRLAVVEPEAITRRVLLLNECLQELMRPDAWNAQAMARDSMLRAAVERWLQVAIEACSDIAFHVVAAEGWTPPETGRAAFATLSAHGLLDSALASRLGRAVGL